VSDIGIRLDGLLLGLVMAAGAIVFAVIAAVAALRTLMTKPASKRSWKVAARSSGLAIIHAAGLVILVFYLEEYGAPMVGPDWLDWLAVPWLGLIVLGLILLVLSRQRTAARAHPEPAPHWRDMKPADLDGVVRVARLAFPDHFEDRASFAERLELYPRGCFTLEIAGEVAGYLIAYPWKAGSAPPLNSLIHALPPDADVLYLHDLALHPDARGGGLTSAIVERLAEQARDDGWSKIALVAVNHAAGFWSKMGFVAVDDPAMAEKLESYGGDAAYMTRPL
jgi:GNAT superfamily N-acetyltransferase